MVFRDLRRARRSVKARAASFTDAENCEISNCAHPARASKERGFGSTSGCDDRGLSERPQDHSRATGCAEWLGKADKSQLNLV